jgi:hypothetical protein
MLIDTATPDDTNFTHLALKTTYKQKNTNNSRLNGKFAMFYY